MEITQVFHPVSRAEWRDWLRRNHRREKEIWVRKPHKDSGEPAIRYDDLVEECLCFGWIDGVVKKYDERSSVQRITPRRGKRSSLSELNRQRMWKLQHLGQMTPAGLERIGGQVGSPDDPFEIPDWIESALREAGAWQTFESFPRFYQRLKVGWIRETAGGKMAEEVRAQRLAHLVKMTLKGRRYGTEPLAEVDPADL